MSNAKKAGAKKPAAKKSDSKSGSGSISWDNARDPKVREKNPSKKG